MIPVIDKEKCIGCGVCVRICPQQILVLGEDRKAEVIMPEKCDELWGCIRVCPVGAIKKV